MRIGRVCISGWRDIFIYGISFGVFTSLVVLLFSFIMDYYSLLPSSPKLVAKKIDLRLLAILSVTIFPLLETFLVQFLIIEIIGTKTSYKRYLSFLVSALCFFCAHLSSETVRQPVFSLFIGFVLSYVYISAEKTATWVAFTTTFVTHAMHNAVLVALLLYGLTST